MILLVWLPSLQVLKTPYYVFKNASWREVGAKRMLLQEK